MVQRTESFSAGTKQTWEVPYETVSPVFVELWGAGGAAGNASGELTAIGSGDPGGYVSGDLAVSEGDVLYVYPGTSGTTGGSGGWPNGGAATKVTKDNSGTVDADSVAVGGAAGGSSEIRLNGDTTYYIVALAGGGGGGGAAASDSALDTSNSATTGGAGGGTAEDGPSADDGSADGTGAASGGGSGEYNGGNGQSNTYDETEYDWPGAASGGGGGGGNDGGQGGIVGRWDFPGASGGGGGDGYASDLTSATQTVAGGNSGDGNVVIDYETPPYAPNNLTHSISRPDVTLTWDERSTADGYNIYRGTASGTYTQIDSVTGSTTTSYTDTPSEQVEQYYYVVTAYDGVGESQNSNEALALLGSGPQVYLSGAFDNKQVRYHDGTSWQYGILKEYDGADWNIIP